MQLNLSLCPLWRGSPRIIYYNYYNLLLIVFTGFIPFQNTYSQGVSSTTAVIAVDNKQDNTGDDTTILPNPDSCSTKNIPVNTFIPNNTHIEICKRLLFITVQDAHENNITIESHMGFESSRDETYIFNLKSGILINPENEEYINLMDYNDLILNTSENMIINLEEYNIISGNYILKLEIFSNQPLEFNITIHNIE